MNTLNSLRREILNPSAFQFVRCLHNEFESRRRDLLHQRSVRQALITSDINALHLLPETEGVRQDHGWQVAEAPQDLRDRRVEITGPAERKMIINALNSGAQVFMADFEDALAPSFHNVLDGQKALAEAVRRTLRMESGGKTYELEEQLATMVVRPRGLHLTENHLEIDGDPVSASLFDFGLYFFHNVAELLDRRTGPYFYLPKLESHLEARWWNDVFIFAQRYFAVPRGTVRATVLIETIPAAFEMEEILFELRDHAAGLNAGRWDYIFSLIKKYHAHVGFILPDRDQVTMATDFMSAYAKRLVQTCHKRGAHAIGGMSAFIPNKAELQVTAQAFEKVASDKKREASLGFDGTWVAHPGLIEIARQELDAVLQGRPHQKESLDLTALDPADLLKTKIAGSRITEVGVRKNIRSSLVYLCHWFSGRGAVGIENLMEDMATAEISRGQLWQWVRYQVKAGETTMTQNILKSWIAEEASEISLDHITEVRAFLEKICLAREFPEFITLEAYEILNQIHDEKSHESISYKPIKESHAIQP